MKRKASRTRRRGRRGPPSSSTPRADRAHRDAGREPARRSVVDLRFHQPRSARLRQGVLELRQAPRGTASQSVRAAARAGASLHPEAAEDRQDGDRRPAGQDRGQGVLPAHAHAGSALSGSGDGAENRAGRRRRDQAQGRRAGLPDALQADLQSPVALARRRRVGAKPTAASWRGCAKSPRSSP